MTPTERKALEAKRTLLLNEQMQAQVKIHQATGAIAMLDAILAVSEEPEAQPPAANGHEQHAD